MSRWNEIAKNGLLPLSAQPLGRSNWKLAPSRRDYVYLSTTYAIKYAAEATAGPDEPLGIVQIDVSALDERKLYPDEDFVGQVLWEAKSFGFPIPIEYQGFETIGELTETINLKRYKSLWGDSLEFLGNVLHEGAIAQTALKCTSIVPSQHKLLIKLAFDPIFHIANNICCRNIYDELTRHLVLGEAPSGLPRTCEEYLRIPIWARRGENGKLMTFDGEIREKILKASNSEVKGLELTPQSLQSYRHLVKYLSENIADL